MADLEWTDERMAALRLLCANHKLTFSEIAEHLTQQFGVDVPRSGCIGKAWRMGIRRGRKPRTRPQRNEPSPPETAVVIWPRWRVADPDPAPRGRVTLQQLDRGMCHWPYGDRAPYLFCGAATAGKTYCAYHTGVSCGYRTTARVPA